MQFKAIVVETSGTADVAGNVITVSDLEYGRVYRVSITAVSDHCPDLETVSVDHPVSLEPPMTTGKDTKYQLHVLDHCEHACMCTLITVCDFFPVERPEPVPFPLGAIIGSEWC